MRRYKLACMSLIFASGQFGESQTLRKSVSFFEVAWTRTLRMLSGKSYCKAVEYCLPNSENPMLICKNCCESRNLSPLTHPP